MSPDPNVNSDEAHVVDRLAEYFSGSLVLDDELAVEGHLLACADCRNEYDRLGEIVLLIALEHDGREELEPSSAACLGRQSALRP